MTDRTKIVLVINAPERDERTNQKIQSAIMRMNPDAHVQILERCDPDMVTKTLEINPDVIMCAPITAQATSPQFYILKYLLNCVLVCFRTEGLASITLPSQFREMAGMENYGVNLIDYEIFWGRKTADEVGKSLIEQNKLSSVRRIRYFGAPFFEDYVGPFPGLDKTLPYHIRCALGQYPREKTVLFVTGFAFADYSPADVLNAGDLVDKKSKTAEKDFEEVLTIVQKTRHFRQMWIDAIIESATKNPEILFVVKTHPMENRHYGIKKVRPYAAFSDYDNILLLTENMPFRAIIHHCSLLFHYGSTTMFESYLSQVPSVYVHSRTVGFGGTKLTRIEFKDLGTPSTLSADIVDVPSIVSRHSTAPIRFERNEEVEEYFKAMLELKIGRDYHPSDRIAEFLLSAVDEAPQLISSDDKYLAQIIHQSGPALIDMLFNKGLSKAEVNDFKGALFYFDKALLVAETGQFQVKKLQYLRSYCLYKMVLIDEAVSAIQQELAVNPDDSQVQELHRQLQPALRGKTTMVVPHTRKDDKFVPKIFEIETILGCDLKCPECAIGADIITRKKGCMTFEQFKIIADKIRPFCEYLYLHIWGEPLLNKDIFEMIKYASAFTKTNISTNGNSLTKEKAEKLIASGVTDIIVSIDGISQDIYEQYRKSGYAIRAMWSLAKLKELNAKYGNKVNIIPQYLVFKHNQHEMDSFREFCNSIGLQPSYQAPYIHKNSIYQNSDYPQYIRPSYPDLESLKHAMQDCGNPKEVFTILLDGSCVMCCYDHDGIINYGNIYEQDVVDIWNSPKYRQDRLDIMTANAPEYCLENCLEWTLCHTQGDGDVVVCNDFAQKNYNCSPTMITTDSYGLSNNIEQQTSENASYGRRLIPHYDVSDSQKCLERARKSFKNGHFNEAFDIYEQLSIAYPAAAIEILAEVYDQYQRLLNRDRYSLYQSRFFNFGINPTDKVLDIGSGNIPFQLATHLADIAINDNYYGRAGVAFKYLDDKSVFECNIENMPFGDKEFDFVCCSHVLEHVHNPQKACDELMRIGKRGYIETPTRAKDLWLNNAKVSNHRWSVKRVHDRLIFTEYAKDQIEGLGSDILSSMHCAPQSIREKAFSALIYLKAHLFNTMLLWENSFRYEVRRLNRSQTNESEDVPVIVEG